MKNKFLSVLFILLFLSSPSSLLGAITSEELSAALLGHLSCFPLELFTVEKQKLSILNKELCLATIYHETGMQPLWVTPEGITPKALIILDFLSKAEQEGLNPEDYALSQLLEIKQASDADSLAIFDILLTYNVVKYIHDISSGRILPSRVDSSLFPEAGDDRYNPLAAVEDLLGADDFAAYLGNLFPGHQHYNALKSALVRYREIDRKGGWPVVPPGKTLRKGMVDERVPVIRTRLFLETGQNIQPEFEPTVYDQILVEEVQRFQQRYGLETDGVIGRETLEAMNVTSGEAVMKIIVNMARWRWQEKELGKRYVLVNIAHFDLTIFSGEEIELQMAVIVGKQQHQTPVFSDRIKYIDFNPFWHVPPGIASKEDLPQLRKDSQYLVNKHIRLFSNWEADALELDSTAIDWQQVSINRMRGYHLRQDPGPWNALGKVKFVFPNTYDVYIHDTATQNLFSHSKRSFSHGCIRVSKPVELAAALLGNGSSDWTLERVKEVIDTGARKVVILPAPLPIHITYQTVWLDKSGNIHFNKDVYDRDKRLQQALFPGRLVEK